MGEYGRQGRGERQGRTGRQRSGSGSGKSTSGRSSSGARRQAQENREQRPRRRRKLTWQQKVRRFLRRLIRKIRRLPREVFLLIGGVILLILLIVLVVSVVRTVLRGGSAQQEETEETQESGEAQESEEESEEEETDTADALRGMDSYTIVTDETQIESLTADLSGIDPASYSASSVLTGASGTVFSADYLFDDDLTTSWQEGEEDAGLGVTLTVVFPSGSEISGIAFWTGNEITQEKFESNNRPAQITVSVSNEGQSYSSVYTLEDLMGEQLILFTEAVPMESVVIRIDSVYEGSVYDDTVISELRFYG